MSHEQWQESAAAYALDSLDANELPEFESHLSSCAECRAAVQEFRDVAGLLVHASAPARAPHGLRFRVASMVRAEETQRPRPRATTRAVLPWVAAAASLALAIGAGTWAGRTSARVDSLAARVTGLNDSLTARDSVLRYLAGPEVHVVSLAAGGDKPVARVFWNHTQQRFIVTAFNLPAPRPGRTYQLWAIAQGTVPMSMGTFNTDASGAATVVLPVSAEILALDFIELCALTEEPAGGSPGPTETPRLTGVWRHTD
jgi:anti-sigma-K factor RskA